MGGVYICIVLFFVGLINFIYCNVYLGWFNIIIGYNKNCKVIYSYNLIVNVVFVVCDIEYLNIYMYLIFYSVFIIF